MELEASEGKRKIAEEKVYTLVATGFNHSFGFEKQMQWVMHYVATFARVDNIPQNFH